MFIHTFITPSRSVTGAFRASPLTAIKQTLKDSFNDLSTTTLQSPLTIRLDVHEDEGAYHVTADLPGLSEKDIEVAFDESILTVSGEKKIDRVSKNGIWHMTERTEGAFSRKLSFSQTIDSEKIEAKFEKGVLQIILPKVPPSPSTVKKINIQKV